MKALTAILAVLVAGVVVVLFLFGEKSASVDSGSSITSPVNSSSLDTSNIIGMWEFFNVGYSSSVPVDDSEVISLKDMYQDLEIYFSFDADGSATYTSKSSGGEINVLDGSWKKLTPDTYEFSYDYYSGVSDYVSTITETIVLSDGILFVRLFETDIDYISEQFKKIE